MTISASTPRLDAIRARLRVHGADAALLAFAPDLRWATGFTGSNGLLIVRPDAAHFVTDGRYDAQARQEVRGADVHVPGYDLAEHVASAGLLHAGELVIVQSEHVAVGTLDRWRGLMQEVRFQPVADLLVELVARKDEAEIECIRAAQAVTDAVFTELLPLIAPGVSELDLAAEVVYLHMKRGCERMAFEPIVASGARSALPHARPTSKTIRPGDLVVLDMGGVLEGYASDMTRTIAVGEPGDEARRVYSVVRDAQQAALDVARAGLTGKQLDRAARDVIEAAGFGSEFSHGLGHGIGLQTHEWPRLSHHVEHLLPIGAAVTIEPGIYLPERFGVRIEDLVVLREHGCENLTASPKDLVVL